MNKILTKLFLSLTFITVFTINAETSINLDEFTFKNAKQPFSKIITGGQPSLQDLKALKEFGIINIVNLRTSAEFDGFDEMAEARKLGLHYVSLEIAGVSGITLENAKKLDEILETLQGITLVHCASSNRVGALFAVRAFAVKGKTMQDAMSDGKNAGLKSLRKKTQALLNELK